MEVGRSGEAMGWGAEEKGEYRGVVDEAGEAGSFYMDTQKARTLTDKVRSVAFVTWTSGRDMG